MTSFKRKTIGLLGGLAAVALTGPALALDEITFGTNWVPEAEHGGFYQAVATGIYAAHGLDVTIHQGGPQINHMQLLLAGRLDLNLGGGGPRFEIAHALKGGGVPFHLPDRKRFERRSARPSRCGPTAKAGDL